MDIKQFIKQLSVLNKINFSGKESEMFLLAQKYDKNHNSVFEKEELNSIKKDLSIFINAESNPDEMSDRELSYFYQSLNPDRTKTVINENVYTMGENASNAEILLEKIDLIAEEMKTYIINLGKESGRKEDFTDEDLNKLLSLSEKQLKRAEKLFNIADGKRQFSGDEIVKLLQLSDKELEKAKQFFYVEERKDNQFSPYDIKELIRIPDEKLEKAKKLFFIEERGQKQFSGEDINDLSSLSDEELKKAEQFFFIEGRSSQFSGCIISELIQLSDDKLKCAKTLFNAQDKEPEYTGLYILELVKLSDKKYEKAQTLFNIEGRDEQLDGDIIAGLANLSEKQFEQAKELLYTKYNDKLLSGYEILALASLSEKEFEHAKKILNDKEFEKVLTGTDIAKFVKLSKKQQKIASDLLLSEDKNIKYLGSSVIDFAKLSDKEFERAKSLFGVKVNGESLLPFAISCFAKLSDKEFERAKKMLNNIDERFDGFDITRFATLSEEEFERAKSLFYIDDMVRQFNSGEIIELSKLEEKDLNWAKQNLFDRNLSGYKCAQIAQNRCDEILKYLDKNTVIEFGYTPGDYVKFEEENGNTYAYDKSGLIETGTEKKLPDNNEFTERVETTIYNRKRRIKQVIIKGKPANSSDEARVLSEDLIYYDINGNVIKTVTLKRNSQNGLLNVSETDKDGNVIPIQSHSIDPNTGTEVIQRDFVSPGGVKTEFYAEQSENLKIKDYKINDKNGKILINIHQTFEKISENKFISSINMTENDTDTQIYEMEYTDNKVKIFDKKNNKTTQIDLNKYFTNKDSLEKLLPIIKQLPGHVLLEFAEKPFTLDYGEDNIQNGFWQTEESLIQIGNYENTIGEEENLLATMTHELGHYLDLYNREHGKYSNNAKVIKIFTEELEELKKSTTTAQQEYISYFISSCGIERGHEEKVAETHAIMNTTNDPSLSIRRLYLAQYFPRTMAAIMKLLLKEEGVM